MGFSSAFRVHSSCLPRALLVRFPSATEGIRGCKGQHDITNTVRHEQDGDTFNGALWSERPCLLINCPLLGVPDRQRWSVLIDHSIWPWRVGNNRKINGKRQHFYLYSNNFNHMNLSGIYMHKCLFPQATGKFDCQIPGIRNVTDQETFWLKKYTGTKIST